MNLHNHFAVTPAIILVTLLTLFVERVAFGQSPQITNGVNYLKTTQNADGSWGGTPTSISGIFPTTIVALDALRAIESGASTNQTNAIAYLTAQELEVTPFIAARVISLAGTSVSVAADVDTLIARQNEDGGWGTSEGFESDTLDTSLALLALKAANVNAPSTLAGGLNYLALRQNLDGGWSLTSGDTSQVFYTSYALQALNSLRLQFGATTFQTRALGYLRTNQSLIDGGSGSPTSTPFETALSLLAIFGSGQPLTIAEGRAVTLLNGTQQQNGSWANDAYSTGLALRALSFPQDSDADGMSDECETANGLNPNNPADAALDNDGDGLPNLEECRRRCLNPNNPDTDGDTLNDGDEIANGSDPCDASSRNRAPTVTSQPVTTAREGEAYSYQVQATDADNDPLTYTLLRSPAGMSISATGQIQWTPASNETGRFTVVIKVSDGRGGVGFQQYGLAVLAQGIDLTVAAVDISALTTNSQSLVVTGSVRVEIQNLGGSLFAGDFQTLLFEDRNDNKTYQMGVDLQLGMARFSGTIDSAGMVQLDVPVSGVVLFRDQLVYAFVDSGQTVTELNETNNVGNSGGGSMFQPPVNQFQPKVKWVHNPLDGLNASMSPYVAPLIDTNADGLINERDIPAVIYRSTFGLRALRGDTGALIWEFREGSGVIFTQGQNLAIGDLDGDGVPEILVPASSGQIYCLNNNGTLRWTSPPRNATASPTIVDLDGDGHAEILSASTVFNFDGTIRRATRNPDYRGGLIAGGTQAVDLDLDGVPEIISGAAAFDRDGNTIWWWQTQGSGPFTFVGTLDRGATTVTIPNFNYIVNDGYTAIANLDDDPNPEIIVVGDSGFGSAGTFVDSLIVFEHDGRIKPPFPIGIELQILNQVSWHPGPPTVADVDGDGRPNIVIPMGKTVSTTTATNVSQSMLLVYEPDGQLKWRREMLTVEGAFGHGAPPTPAFDFDGDGAAELVYQSAQKLIILNGRNGQTLYEIGVGRNGTTSSVSPAIADVDNDGVAEIVVNGTSIPDGSPVRTGVLVLGDTSGNWRNARRIWNQWLYHITNVEEDAGIPLIAANNWQTLNNSRTQLHVDGVDPTAAPDLTVSRVTVNTQTCPAGLAITARIGNGGSLHVAVGQRVSFYSGDPDAGGTLLGTRQTTRALYPGEFEDVTLTNVNPPTSAPVFAAVNEPPIETLTQSNNLARLPHTWAQASGYCPNCSILSNIFVYRGIDGVISPFIWEEAFASAIPTSPPFYEVRFQFPVNPTSVTLENDGANNAGFLTGTLDFSNGFSTPFSFDANGEGTVSFPAQQNVTWVRLTGATTRQRGPSVSEFIIPGSYTEPLFRINEGTGRSGNNKASSGVATCDPSVNQAPTITSAPVITASTGTPYSYQVQAVDPNSDPLTFSLATAPTGMTINTAGLISWSPTAAQAGTAAVTVQVSDNRNGSAEQPFTIAVTGPGGNQSPLFTSTPPVAIAQGQTLQYDVTATDADGDAVLFTLRQAPVGATLDQFSGRLLWTPTVTHTGTQFFTVVAEDGRGGSSQQSFAVAVRASVDIDPPLDQDGDGYLVPEDCDDANPNVNPGRVEIPGNGLDDDCNPETPDTLPSSALTCSLVSDQRSYNSNSLAQLTARISNTTAATTANGLQAQISVADSAGQGVFDSTLPLNSLAPRAASRSVVPFNTEARTPGQYQSALTIRYGNSTVCQAQATFSILSSATQGTALTGTVTATPAILNRGETATLAYQVSNVGNVDLAALNLNLLVVKVSDGSVTQTFSEQTTLNRGQAFNTNRILDTAAMNPGEYLIVLRGETGGTTQTVASAPLRINASSIHFSAAAYVIAENAGIVQVTVQRSGDTSAAATVEYQTTDDKASERSDHTTSLGTLRFAAGELSKTFDVLVNDDSFAELSEPLNLSLTNPVGAGLGIQSSASLTLMDSGRTGANPLDHDAAFFVRQHYHDFLNREPDSAGLQFWTNQITQCGTDAQCIEIKRINVSAAFYLSIEFQETGYLVHRTYRAAYGRLPRYREFLRDTQEIGRGVVVGQGDWLGQIEANKQAFANEYVARSSFLVQYPAAMTPAQFVDALNANTEGSLTQAERDQLVADMVAGVKTRAQVLRVVAENSAFNRREFNRAFVYMQYVGYLRRNPDDAPDNNLDGLNFWLAKLNQFNGNFIQAEMVKAFLVSGEYRERFGQP
ncbi:MAG: putative Ig domain-containing protein [Pyrinomonadaceae bacterium]|nr:putative Ig domain-containing protein [Pyrinomonadaceae bacterium]